GGLRVRRAHRDLGIPLRATAVIARTLEPYAALFSRVLGEHGLPFVTSATRPAQGEARVMAALQLARSALGDFPRQPLFDLGRSGLARLRGEDPAGPAHGWDRLSRDWGVAGGLETWTRELPRWVEAWRPHGEADADEATPEGAA